MSNFKHGELILISKPYAYVLGTEFMCQRCDFCFKRKDGLKRCTQCRFAHFCDKSCQAKGWELHKLECKYIAKAEVKPTSAFRLLSLILLKTKKYGKDDPYEEVLGRRMSIGSLMSHSEDIKNDPFLSKVISTALVTIGLYIGLSNVPEREEFIEIFGKLRVNGFSISDDYDSQVVGCGLYLGAAAFDHSCEPNTELVFDGVNLCIRANQDISNCDLSQIYVCYIEQLQLTEARKKNLRDIYYFECECSRCKTADCDSRMTEMLISGKDAEKELLRVEKETKRLKKMLEEKVDQKTINEAYIKELEIQHKTLAANNIYKVQSLIFSYENCIKLSLWGDSVLLGHHLLDPYKLYYGPFSRKFGLHLFKFGKIILYHGSRSAAKCILEQAATILKRTHGERHLVYQELLKLLDEAHQ